MDWSALLEQQHALLLEWISLLERGLAVLANGSPEELRAVEAEKVCLLQRWQAQRAAPATGNAPLSQEHEALPRRVQAATRQAIQVNRQFTHALHRREQMVASRLQVLFAAAGTSEVYSNAGYVRPAQLMRSARNIA
jgi:hypothetical protein